MDIKIQNFEKFLNLSADLDLKPLVCFKNQKCRKSDQRWGSKADMRERERDRE